MAYKFLKVYWILNSMKNLKKIINTIWFFSNVYLFIEKTFELFLVEKLYYAICEYDRYIIVQMYIKSISH